MPLFDGSRPGPGRPKGSLNRWSAASLDAVADVFEKLGGVEAMTEWARANPSDFYRGIYARLLPTRTEVDARIEPVHSVQDMTDAELLALVQRRGADCGLDVSVAGTQLGAETQLEAVGAVHRPEDARVRLRSRAPPGKAGAACAATAAEVTKPGSADV